MQIWKQQQSQSAAATKQKCLSRCLNCPSLTSGWWSWAWRLFHNSGPAMLNEISLKRDCMGGTTSRVSAERTRRRPTLATKWQSSAKYGSVKLFSDLYINRANLYSTRLYTGSQCSSQRIGEIVLSPSTRNQLCCCILHWLQVLHKVTGNAVQHG